MLNTKENEIENEKRSFPKEQHDIIWSNTTFQEHFQD